MACARCEFHIPGQSQAATALVAKEGLQRMLTEMPSDEAERAVVEGGVDAMDSLAAKLRHVPTPDGRTPAEIEAARAKFSGPRCRARCAAQSGRGGGGSYQAPTPQHDPDPSCLSRDRVREDTTAAR